MGVSAPCPLRLYQRFVPIKPLNTKPLLVFSILVRIGGEGGIRTHGRVAPTPVFETGPFDRSGTSPRGANCIIKGRNHRLEHACPLHRHPAAASGTPWSPYGPDRPEGRNADGRRSGGVSNLPNPDARPQALHEAYGMIRSSPSR